MLIPYDCSMKLPDGSVITGIPDYTIAGYLNHIAYNRGNNVVRMIIFVYNFRTCLVITDIFRWSFWIHAIRHLVHGTSAVLTPLGVSLIVQAYLLESFHHGAIASHAHED